MFCFHLQGVVAVYESMTPEDGESITLLLSFTTHQTQILKDKFVHKFPLP